MSVIRKVYSIEERQQTGGGVALTTVPTFVSLQQNIFPELFSFGRRSSLQDLPRESAPERGRTERSEQAAEPGAPSDKGTP